MPAAHRTRLRDGRTIDLDALAARWRSSKMTDEDNRLLPELLANPQVRTWLLVSVGYNTRWHAELLGIDLDAFDPDLGADEDLDEGVIL